MKSRSVTDIPEYELANLLRRDPVFSSLLHGVTGTSPGVTKFLQVPLKELFPGEREQLGDVDLLLVPRETQAVAIQFKRVKVPTSAFATGNPGKLRGLKKGVHQCNDLVSRGFYRVMLGIILVVDGRERTEFNFAFRGATDEHLRAVKSAVDQHLLSARAGIFIIEIAQPLDRDITLSAGIVPRLLRWGTTGAQPERLTRHLRDWMNWGAGVRANKPVDRRARSS